MQLNEWRRGLWRLWLVFAAVWVSFWCWQKDVPCLLGFNYFGQKWWCGDVIVPPAGYVFVLRDTTAFFIIGIPLVVLAVGAAMAWAFSGFTK